MAQQVGEHLDQPIRIDRLASNLGMSNDKVRAAIKQVEGNGPFYVVVPLPAFGR